MNMAESSTTFPNADEALLIALDALRTTAAALAEKRYIAWAATTLELARNIEKIARRPA